ncbi:MAG: OmpP1/FadL family transporter [Bacteroidales bacterium]
MKKIFLGIVILFSLNSWAQNEVEGLRFSRTFHGGTARFTAMGGAFAALGGDASTLGFNPAGIGVYRSSELSITPSLDYTKNTSHYMGNRLSDNDYQFSLANIGAIGVIPTGLGNNSLVSVNVGFSYNRLNSFNERIAVRGNAVDGNNSYTAYFADVANGNVSSAEGEMAYSAGLIDTVSGIWQSLIGSHDRTRQKRSGESWGSTSEFDFSIGGNLAHIIYFGATIGVRRTSYGEELLDTETMLEGGSSSFQEFRYAKHFQMIGTGYNFKFGLIGRPFAHQDFLSGLRIGAAIHSPTFLGVTDRFTTGLRTKLVDFDTSIHRRYSDFEYRIQTPLTFMLGAAYTFGSQGSEWRGVVSLDYEYTDYARIKMRDERRVDDSFSDANDAIQTYYRSVANFRLGGEVNYQKFALRAGFAHYGNPYTSDVAKTGAASIYSVGAGYRGKFTFVDFAYSLLSQEDKSYMYSGYTVQSNEITYDILRSTFTLTFGLRF